MDRNSRFLTLVIALGLSAAAASAAPCAAGGTTLCLSAQRFGVTVQWKDFQGNTGQGQAVGLTADTGYFWFFSASNVELIVKVLDARAINQKFWVFFGALSNVEYTLTVTDSVTGAVKRYQNPSGQFASVGDTSAFSGSGNVVASSETVVTRGAVAPPSSIADIQRFIERAGPSPAAAPCPGPATTLSLSNCRFAVNVAWTDPQGNFGAGQAVQLSADTGYFWFFSNTNVELMVKVLDARAINGQFWVFFGALSNVEYTITVTDTVSGALHSYQNPANTFASVGDTAAFRGGYGISVQPDAARAASSTIAAAAGGGLSATAADGTVFTLTVPANALLYDQDVTMTPVQATGAFPFAGGLAAGVQLEPKGLVLLAGAKLSFHTSTPIARPEETPVAWNGSGEDFFLFPPTPAGGDLELFITHFGGYGVARGTDAERSTQLGRQPVGDDDLLSHQTSPLLRQGRIVAAATLPQYESTEDWKSDLKTKLDDVYSILSNVMVTMPGEPQQVIRVIQQTLSWWLVVEKYLGPLDTVFPGRKASMFALFETIVRRALGRIHDACKQDPNAINELQPIAEMARYLSLGVTLEIEAVMGCLTFDLHFFSKLTETLSGFTLTKAVEAKFTLETKKLPSGFHQTIGQGTLNYTQNSVAGLPDGCTESHSSSTSTFKAFLRWSNFTRGAPLSFDLLYDTGSPSDNVTVHCADISAPFDDRWADLFEALYTDQRGSKLDGDYPFFESDWTRTGAKDPWALAAISKTFAGITNTAAFALSHMPK